MTGITGMTAGGGKPPEIDTISTMSYEIQRRDGRHDPRRSIGSSVLDSEVKGMEKFAKVYVPESHITSGRKGADSVLSMQNC